MKQNFYFVLLIGTCGLFGCGGGEKGGGGGGAPAMTNAGLNQLQSTAGETMACAKTITTETKEQFLSSLSSKLRDWDAKLGVLSKKCRALGDDARADGNKALDALREQRTQLGICFNNLKSSGEDFGQEAKSALETATAKLEKAYEDAKTKLHP